MTTLEEVEIKLEAARRSILLSIETRDQMQELADAQDDQIYKDILAIAVIQMNTNIVEQQMELAEANIMLLNYKARLAALQQ